ncbi:MAG TPA: hypothetical protein VGQ46_19290 [Thermoanaerobaculia bacterium]|nr:hypothetical protein [Thermoanaerobaculia bacterium]
MDYFDEDLDYLDEDLDYIDEDLDYIDVDSDYIDVDRYYTGLCSVKTSNLSMTILSTSTIGLWMRTKMPRSWVEALF